MKKKLGLFVLFVSMLFSVSAFALPTTNLGFELGDLTDWLTDCPTGTVSVVTSSSAHDGTTYNPQEGSYMAEITATSALGTGFTWQVGDSITFDWAFLAMDFLPWNDYAEFGLVDDSLNPIDSEFLSNVSSVGNYGDTGWQTFTYVFGTSGSGYFGFQSVNDIDEGFDSVLLVDNIQVQSAPVPEPATILLVGTGLLGIIAFGRKRFDKKA